MLLRPRGAFLGSSRAARRASLRAERRKAFSHAFRTLTAMVKDVCGAVVDLAVLWLLPLAYLAAAFLAVDLPARWAANREPFTGTGFLLFLGSIGLSVLAVSRMVRGVQPVVPVSRRFASRMLVASWIGALVFAFGDLATK